MDEKRMSKNEHLRELWRTLILGTGVVLVVITTLHASWEQVGMPFLSFFYGFSHLADPNNYVAALHQMRLGGSIVLGVYWGAGLFLMQLLRFAVPGLEPKEKKAAILLFAFLLAVVYFGIPLAVHWITPMLSHLLLRTPLFHDKDAGAVLGVLNRTFLISLVFLFVAPNAILSQVFHHPNLRRVRTGYLMFLLLLLLCSALMPPSLFVLTFFFGPILFGLGWLGSKMWDKTVSTENRQQHRGVKWSDASNSYIESLQKVPEGSRHTAIPNAIDPERLGTKATLCTCNPVGPVHRCSCVGFSSHPSAGRPMLCTCVPVAHAGTNSPPPSASAVACSPLSQEEALSRLAEYPRSSPAEMPSSGVRGGEHRTDDRVDCTVFAPPEVSRGCDFLVQVFAHCPEDEAVVRAMATEFDDSAVSRGFRSLEKNIPRGSRLTFHLSVPTLVVDDPIQHLTWKGRSESVQYAVSVPPGRRAGTVIAKVVVTLASVPIGHIKFTLKVAEVLAGRQQMQPLGEQARLYSLAFVSYATADRPKVLERVQMLQALGIRYFQDVLDIAPGAQWERTLYDYIDQCDLFLLFWSSAARNSEWVMKEIAYALNRKGDDDYAPPEILPIIIEGPPIVPPPDNLRHLHFSDHLVYLMVPPDHASFL